MFHLPEISSLHVSEVLYMKRFSQLLLKIALVRSMHKMERFWRDDVTLDLQKWLLHMVCGSSHEKWTFKTLLWLESWSLEPKIMKQSYCHIIAKSFKPNFTKILIETNLWILFHDVFSKLACLWFRKTQNVFAKIVCITQKHIRNDAK